MSLKNRSILALTAGFLIIFSIVSCITTDYSIGSRYAPSDQEMVLNIAEMPIPIGQKMSDSIQSSCYQLTFGSLYDDEYGITRVDLAATITPQDTGYRFPKDFEVKEAYLYFSLNEVKTYVENQDRIFQNFSVYQLDRILDSTTIYSNSITEKDYSQIISRGTTFFAGGDSLIVYLKKDFAKNYLIATEEEFDSLPLYVKSHKGIYIKPDLPIGSDERCGRLNSFGGITMEVEYRFLDTTIGVMRDTLCSFDVGSSSYGFAIETYSHETKKYEVDCDNDREYLMYEGMAGIKPFVSGVMFKGLLDDWAESIGVEPGRIMVSRASIILPYESPEDYKQLNYYPSAIFPCTRSANSKKLLQYTPLFTIYDDSFSKGDINTSLNYYKPDVTMFVQNLLRSERDSIDSSYDLWLIAPFGYTMENSGGYNNYYDYSLYDPYSSYGFGYTGSDMYNSSYYSQIMASLYASQSANSTYYYADYINYSIAKLNGNGADRHPTLEICYSIMAENEEVKK